MTVKKYSKQSDIDKYKKQWNKVNNLKKIAKEHFEQNLDNIILENISNPKTYWKIMKMLIKSNKGCNNNIPPSPKYNSGWRTRGDSLRRRREVWITK